MIVEKIEVAATYSGALGIYELRRVSVWSSMSIHPNVSWEAIAPDGSILGWSNARLGLDNVSCLIGIIRQDLDLDRALVLTDPMHEPSETEWDY